MPEHTSIRKALCAVAVTALTMFAGPGVARADVFQIIFTGWFDSSSPPSASRIFTGLASVTPESLDGFGNGVICTVKGCFGPPGDDPVVDMSTGDPNPQIHFTPGQTFSFTITPTINAFDLINNDPIHPAMAFDFTTPFGANDPLNGQLFTCDGNAFPECGFQVQGDQTLAIRFSGSPEPATLWLLLAAAAGTALGWRKLRARI
jgi:hypothetical protein